MPADFTRLLINRVNIDIKAAVINGGQVIWCKGKPVACRRKCTLGHVVFQVTCQRKGDGPIFTSQTGMNMGTTSDIGGHFTFQASKTTVDNQAVFNDFCLHYARCIARYYRLLITAGEVCPQNG